MHNYLKIDTTVCINHAQLFKKVGQLFIIDILEDAQEKQKELTNMDKMCIKKQNIFKRNCTIVHNNYAQLF